MKLCLSCLVENKPFLGRNIYLPKGRKVADSKEIIKLRKQGTTIHQIATRLEITPRRVYQILNLSKRQSNGLDRV